MAAQLDAMVDLASVYQLRLGADGHRIEWIERDGEGRETVHLEEPETSPWLRFKLWLLGPLVPVQEL
jgi:putative cardiolipin synthase